MKTVLTIAGSDCSGGAGIQADIKTITAHKLYAMSAVTAMTAQNTTGVCDIQESTPQFLSQQLDCIFTDIMPDAVKIGMVFDVPLIEVIADKIKKYQPNNIVLDPVMLSTSGKALLREEAAGALQELLMPNVHLLTPNLPEAAELVGRQLCKKEDIELAACELANRYKAAVLIKGGHGEDTADDLLCQRNGQLRWYKGERIDNPNSHGTGCTLSSAIACNLAQGKGLEESVFNAKQYLSGALRTGMNLGKGSGPLEHTYWLEIRR